MDARSIELLARWRAGDQQAASDLFHRHADRLRALARSRMSEKLSRRVDAEDVVQSVYQSFFAAVRSGRYEITHSGDLWALLVTITLNKVRRQIEWHSAGKRAMNREEGGADPFSSASPVAAHEPGPDEAAALEDEVEHLMLGLDPLQRQMVELRLQGYMLDEIASQTHRSERTVRRVLDQVKHRLELLQSETVEEELLLAGANA